MIGCGKRADPQVCRGQAEELGRFLAAADQGPGVTDPRRLAARPALPPLPAARENLRVAQVRPDGLVTERQKVEWTEGPGALEDALGEVRKLATPDPALTLAIDEATPWAEVAPVLTAAAAVGFDHVRLLFAGARPPPPPRSAVEDELDRIDKGEPSERATQAAKVMAGVVKDCPALQRVFGVVSSRGGDKAQRLIAAIPPALIECGCAIDLPSLRSMMWRVVGSEPALTEATVALGQGGEALALPAATPWREACARLLAAKGPVRPTIAP
jgi:hypothetical protein